MTRGLQCRLTADEQACVLAWSLEQIPLVEQARRLQKKPAGLMATVRRLQREGRLPRRSRAIRGPTWTPQEIDRLIDLIERGVSIDRIARKLGRSKEAIKVKAVRLGVSFRRVRSILSAQEAARALGVPCAKTVIKWIEAFGLRARVRTDRGRRYYAITWESLCAWLEDRAHWMAYDPARVAVPTLREHLIEIRQGQPRWLRPGEVARRYSVGVNTVKQWVAKGVVPATRWGNWWIDEGDLAGFVPPCERSRAGIPRAHRRLLVGQDCIVAGPPVGNARRAA